MSGVKPKTRTATPPATTLEGVNPKRLTIVEYPAAVLRKKAVPVEKITPDLAAVAERMFALMREQKGVGLAAPQVGLSVRMFVCNPTGEPQHDLVCVNPKFLELVGAEEGPEGCLSLPDVSVTMRRATKVIMEALDARGKAYRVEGKDLCARVWQHEVDHLNGKLIIDTMSDTDAIANRRAIKALDDKARDNKARAAKKR